MTSWLCSALAELSELEAEAVQCGAERTLFLQQLSTGAAGAAGMGQNASVTQAPLQTQQTSQGKNNQINSILRRIVYQVHSITKTDYATVHNL